MSDFEITVETRYIEKESDPQNQRYVFAYTITINNLSSQPARLLNRRWTITSASGDAQQVSGPGVVGRQPRIEPGAFFRYSSAAILETPVGSMQGAYEFQRDDESLFEVEIPAFSLFVPSMVH